MNRSPVTESEAVSQISVIDLLSILASQGRVLGLAALISCALSVSVAFLIKPTFVAEATILPPQQQQSSLSALASGALGSLAGPGMASQFGLKNPGDLYIGILGSRTISDALITHFNLESVYGLELMSQARAALAKHATFTSGKDSLIKIAVEDHDPKRAADLANAYVSELYLQNSRLAISEAAQRRLFFEGELRKEKDALANAEVDFRNTEQATGVISPSGQAEVLIRSDAQLRAAVSSREVELQAMRTYATDENPDVQRLTHEVGALQGQIAQLQTKQNTGSGMSAQKLPQATLAYIRSAREFKYHETLFELLSRQFEAARIDEAKQAPVIQIVDNATVPDRKAWPPRLGLSLIGTLLGTGLVCCYLLVIHFRQQNDQAWQRGQKELFRSHR